MAQATAAGSMTALTGDVHIERAGTTVPATPGTAVDVGDRIVSGPNSRATITLTDNSKLELDESSALVIDQQMVGPNTRHTKLSLFSGLVRSFVSYSSSPTPNFEVHTPNAVASARGTEYDTSTSNQAPNTMSDEDRKKYKDCRRFTEVSVYDGTVEVTNTTNPAADRCKCHRATRRRWYAASRRFRRANSLLPLLRPGSVAAPPASSSVARSWRAGRRRADWPRAGSSAVAAAVTRK